MEKQRIVRTYSGRSFIWVLLVALIMLIGQAHWAALFVLLLGLFLSLYELLFDLPGGRFSVDSSGIDTYIGSRCYKHPWEKLSHCGIVYSDVQLGKQRRIPDWYWVYLSTRPLTKTEEERLLRKTYKDFENIAVFQYSEEALQQLLSHAPENLCVQLENLPRPPKGIPTNIYREGKIMHRKICTRK